MSSSEENPASAAQTTADDSDGSESSESSSKASPKSKKKTMIGLGKLRKSLEKSSSGKKGKSLRIPKPPSRRKKKTSLGLPRPGRADAPSGAQQDRAEQEADEQEKVRSTLTLGPKELEEDSEGDVVEEDGSSTDRIDDPGFVEDDDGPSTDQMSADEIPESLASLSAAAEAAGRPASEQSADVRHARAEAPTATSSLIEDVELDADQLPDDEMEAEATKLTDSPFEASAEEDFGGDATMITDSMMGTDAEDLGSAEEDFGGDATMVTDSGLTDSGLTDSGLGVDPDELDDFDAGDKTSVSMVGSPALDADLTPPEHTRSGKNRVAGKRPSPTPETHSTNPNPPASAKARSTPTGPSRDRPDPDQSGEHQSGDLSAEGSLNDSSEPGEFHAEATEVFDSPYENEALVPRLSVLSGPATGQEFLLNKKRNTVGRGKNNTIMISDLAMSRQHFEISENNDQSYTVIDLQSANGTRLNGTAIEEAELIHGDRVEAGKTEVQFVIPGNRPQQRSRNRRIVPKREVSTPGHNNTMVRQMGTSAAEDDSTTDRILTYVIIGAGVLSLCLIGAALVLYFNDGATTDKPTARATAAETPQAQVKYLEGVDKVKERDWAQARVIFEQLAEDAPEFPGVQAQLTRIEREEAALDKLERAREALEDGEQEEAAQIARSISNETAYFQEAQDLVRKTRQHRVAALYEKAQEAVTDEEFATATSHLEALLEEVPNHKGALELRETIEATQQEDEEADEEDRAPSRVVTRKPSRGSSTSNDDWLSGSSESNTSSRSGTRRKVNFTKGFTLYKSGNYKAAAAHFRGIASNASGGLKTRADTAAKNIDKFASADSRANRAFDAGAWKTAIDALGKAKRADRSVARSGYYSQEIGSKMATAHAKLGLAQIARGKYSSAAHHYKKGKGYGSSSELTSLRRELSNQARSLYIQAANKRKTDPKKAADLCRQITAMVPSSNSMHGKATKMLEELE